MTHKDKVHRDKWLTIAEAFATEPGERSSGWKNIAATGLCRAMWHVDIPRHCLSGIRRTGTFWWPIEGQTYWERRYDFLRSTFACFMAAMDEKEFNQLLEG